ncbi:MAG: bacillithiol biosynthesis deacetylase BshB1 [Bacteroidia bacterium]|nr:bacillithiol biosynthesis deacetylase BshB1 [Bacteroidia bacterium]
MMKLDILVFAAHPDDVELACSATIVKMISRGKKVGIIDLTRGELGSRGTAEIREKEALAAMKIMGVHVRENLGFRDGFFVQDEIHEKAIIEVIRKYQPEVVIANAPSDRHPDHGRASKLVRDAAFLSGLRRIETTFEGREQAAWRPKRLFYYIQDHALEPDFVVDVSEWYDKKRETLRAFTSQFFDPESKEPETYISSREFWDFVEARARIFGHMIGVAFGEGFISETPLKVEMPTDLI